MTIECKKFPGVHFLKFISFVHTAKRSTEKGKFESADPGQVRKGATACGEHQTPIVKLVWSQKIDCLTILYDKKLWYPTTSFFIHLHSSSSWNQFNARENPSDQVYRAEYNRIEGISSRADPSIRLMEDVVFGFTSCREANLPNYCF